MKKKLCIIIALILALGCTSCGEASDNDADPVVSSNVEISFDVNASSGASGVSSETYLKTEEETDSESVAESSEADLTESQAESFPEGSSSENNSPEETNVDTVTLTLKSVIVGDEVDDLISLPDENDNVLSINVNEDGSVTIVCTREYYEEALQKAKEECSRIMDEIVPKGDYPTITNIEYNDDFTEFYITVTDEESYNNSLDSMFMFYVYYAAGIYHAYAQTQDVTITVHMIDQNNNEFATEVITDET